MTLSMMGLSSTGESIGFYMLLLGLYTILFLILLLPVTIAVSLLELQSGEWEFTVEQSGNKPHTKNRSPRKNPFCLLTAVFGWWCCGE